MRGRRRNKAGARTRTGHGSLPSLVLAVVLGAGALLAAGVASLPLGSGPVGASMVRPNALSPGSAPAGASATGEVPATQNLSLSVVLPPANEAALTTLLHEQSDPASPEYHHWLAPGQFAKQFAPAPSSVAAVTSWLRGQGLTPSVSGYQVTIDAPASKVSSALGTRFESYRLRSGSTGYVASSAPLVPADLGSTITSIIGLNTTAQSMPASVIDNPHDLEPAPHLDQPDADGLSPCSAANDAAADNGSYTMDQVGSAYGVNSLLSAGQNGTGETIGLYELGQSSASDINTYKSCFGLTNPFAVQAVDGGGTPNANGTVEADLDVEQVMTQAPKASVISYEGPNTVQGALDTWTEIVTADAAQVVSTSWGMCEPEAESAGLQGAFTTLFERASAQGQSIFAATGDSGTEACLSENGSTGLAVQYPSSDPWVTAVGGTDLFNDSASDQTVWNNCQGDENLSCAESMGDEGAGTGGMSIYEPPPSDQPHLYSWQTTEPCGTECREVPDISANAGVSMVIYANGGWTEAGGTSFAAPFMGGMVADTDSGCGRVGLLTPLLYSLYSEGSYGTAFTDVTQGDTDLTGSNGGDFPALSGYDAATGIGTPIAGGLTCTSVSAVSPGYAGAQVTVSGLGLEHAAIFFGSTAATVTAATATTATVVVPAGSGTVTVSATGIAGSPSQTASFTYGTAPAPPPPPPAPAQHGYWLVGSDGGIFTFGSAQFYGSTGSLHLQRPVVGIVPTAAKTGYWLDASDGGVFAFDAGFYGSIPGLGIHPAGSGLPNSLDAPIVGMVPSADGGGYFMVASDGGVFAFGDAKFAGSCPGIGGCSGAAVAVMPDASGNGYWLVTQSGHVYTFGDAPYYGAPGPQSVPVTSAVRTPDGRGYWILFANGAVAPFGDAGNFGGPAGQMGALDPANAIFTTSDGGGYWVASANGIVDSYGDAPNDGDVAGSKLNAPIIAASGW
jgi:hypothetical protein